MCGMADQLGETTGGLPWLLIFSGQLMVWGGVAITAGHPSPSAWLIGLIGIALYVYYGVSRSRARVAPIRAAPRLEATYR